MTTDVPAIELTRHLVTGAYQALIPATTPLTPSRLKYPKQLDAVRQLAVD